jgi:hypothetical protein
MGKCIALVAAAAALVVAASSASAGNPNTLTLAVYGDAPYGTSNADTAEFAATPAFITSINDDASVQEVIHVGDIHSGSQNCTVAYDQSIHWLWTAYRDPLVYTPGDNEWSDCTKSKELPGSDFSADPQMPLTQLGVVRSIFFPQPGLTLGQNPIEVTSQADAFDPVHPEDALYVENVMWEQSKTNYEPIIAAMASNALIYGKPVLYMNGDSHVYRSDNPLQQGSTCYTESGACTADAWKQHPYYDVPNFRRIVVHGSTFPLEWLELTIDPRAAWENSATPTSWGPFSWQREIQATPSSETSRSAPVAAYGNRWGQGSG